MNRQKASAEAARRGAARAERERETLRTERYAQRLQKEGRAPAPSAASAPRPPPVYEVEVVPGLEPFAREELRRLLRGRLTLRPGPAEGTLSLEHRGDARSLLSLGTAAAIYRVHRFDVPRPRALLGEEHLQTLLQLIQSIQGLHPEQPFRSFRLSAAGVTTPVFHRLASLLESRTGLSPDPDEGDLLIRVRRAGPPVLTRALGCGTAAVGERVGERPLRGPSVRDADGQPARERPALSGIAGRGDTCGYSRGRHDLDHPGRLPVGSEPDAAPD